MTFNRLLVTYFGLLFVILAAASEDQGPGDVPSVTKPYDSATMPSGQRILSGQVFGAGRWAANVELTVKLADQDEATSLVGEVVSNHLGESDEHVVAALLDAEDHKIGVRFSGEESVAWTEGGETNGDTAALFAKSIGLLGLLVELPGDEQTRVEVLDQLTLKNLGIGVNGKNNAYLVEATAKDGVPLPDRIASLGVDRILIAVSTTDTMPRRIIATSAAGAFVDLKLQSISLTVRYGRMQFNPTPPDDATTLELAAAEVELENPFADDPESNARGKRLYLADCVVCHSLDGTGRNSDVTDNAADLTDTAYWLSDGSDEATFLAIRDGAGDEMPGYKDDYRDDNKIWDLVNYIRRLQAGN